METMNDDAMNNEQVVENGARGKVWIKWGGLVLVLLGVVQLALPYFLYAKAIKYVTAIEAITIPLIEPILNPIWVFLLLAERPGPMAILGGVIILAAVLLRAAAPVLRVRSTHRRSR